MLKIGEVRDEDSLFYFAHFPCDLEPEKLEIHGPDKAKKFGILLQKVIESKGCFPTFINWMILNRK